MTFLTPFAALVGLAALLPLAAGAFGVARASAARRALGLAAPAHRAGVFEPTLAAAAIAVLGLAAAQPTLAHASEYRARTDVQTLFVLDTSRSMAASATPSLPTRLERALAAAARLRATIPEVAAGVATLTDRVVPNLVPVADADAFYAVLDRAVAIDSPPPRRTRVRSTTYAALANIATGNYFDRGAGRRIVVLLTDGESNPVDSGEIARALGRERGYRLLAVRFWRSGEAVFGSNRKREAAYRPDPAGRATVAGIAAATGGRAFEQDQLGAASGYLVHLAGRGPTRPAAAPEQSRTPLAPYVAVAALLLLVASVWAGRAN
jgi:von Willebrand factor type A domain